jgi:hypothetical protein
MNDSTNEPAVQLAPDLQFQLGERVRRWSAHSHRLGLSDLLDTLFGAAEPLAPLGAQLLWMAQPVLGLAVPSDEIDALARLLDSDSGREWLGEQWRTAGTHDEGP